MTEWTGEFIPNKEFGCWLLKKYQQRKVNPPDNTTPGPRVITFK